MDTWVASTFLVVVSNAAMNVDIFGYLFDIYFHLC